MNSVKNGFLTPREISRYAERELNILKKRSACSCPAFDSKGRRQAEAKRMENSVKYLSRLTDIMVDRSPEYLEEGKVFKKILADSLDKSNYCLTISEIGYLQGTLEVLAALGNSLSAPGAISQAALAVLKGQNFVFGLDPKRDTGVPDWHQNNDEWSQERYKNPALIKGGLKAIEEIAAFQDDLPAQSIIAGSPKQAISLEYLKNLDSYREPTLKTFSQMAKKELALLHREPCSLKYTGGERSYRLSGEAEASLRVIGELARYSLENGGEEEAVAVKKIAAHALRFKGCHPSERAGNFQGALEVIAALDESDEKKQIGKAAGRVLKGTELVFNCGGNARSAGSRLKKLSRRLQGKPEPSGWELPREEMFENWKNEKLYQSGLESIAILAGEAGCCKAKKIIRKQSGEKALKNLKKIH